MLAGDQYKCKSDVVLDFVDRYLTRQAITEGAVMEYVNTCAAPLLPFEILAHHFIKLDIVRSVEVSQLLNGVSVYLHMSSAFGFAQAAGRAAALRLLKAREALGAVEIEVFVCDNAL